MLNSDIQAGCFLPSGNGLGPCIVSPSKELRCRIVLLFRWDSS